MAGRVYGLLGDEEETVESLLDLLEGSAPFDGTDVQCDGRTLDLRERRRRFARLGDESRLVPRISGLDFLLLGNQHAFTRFGFVRWGLLRGRSASILERFGPRIDLDVPVHRLGPAERNVLQIARVFLSERRLLLLERPLRHLDRKSFETFLEILSERTREGLTTLYVPGRFDELRLAADRLLVVSKGELLEIPNFLEKDPKEIENLLAEGGTVNLVEMNHPILRARKTMEKAVEEPHLNFRALAERSGLAWGTFERRFKGETGLSPKQYFLAMKIRRAKELLARSDARIEEVARLSGFEDPLYFSRLFRKKEGVPPSAWRRSRENLPPSF